MGRSVEGTGRFRVSGLGSSALGLGARTLLNSSSELELGPRNPTP